MSRKSRREYIAILRRRYKSADRLERSKIIEELSKNCEIHRKSAQRLLLPRLKTSITRSGRKAIYSPETILHLKILWKEMDYACSQKMVAAFPFWLVHYECTQEIKDQLLVMSASTIDRSLRVFRADRLRKNNTGTKPGRMLKNIIPVKPLDYNVTAPGNVDADTVAHCGNSLSGEFAHSVTFTDIHLGWTINRAIWSNSGKEVVSAVRYAESKLPFAIRQFGCDNGSEFINHTLISFFADKTLRSNLIKMHRGRPYRSNDQCHVEQKNWTHVRQLFGYIRIENKELLPLMNEIYAVWELYQNFFIPQVKLKRKTRIGARMRREYTAPITPYQRALDCADIEESQKERLRGIYAALNPFTLKRELDQKLRLFMKR